MKRKSYLGKCDGNLEIQSEEMHNTMIFNSFYKKEEKKIQLLLLSKFVTVGKNEIIRWVK